MTTGYTAPLSYPESLSGSHIAPRSAVGRLVRRPPQSYPGNTVVPDKVECIGFDTHKPNVYIKQTQVTWWPGLATPSLLRTLARWVAHILQCYDVSRKET